MSRTEYDASWLLRIVAGLSFVALVARLVAAALPGSWTGIETWIRRADATSGLLAQLTVLVGSSLLVLLVISTLASRDLGAVYRILVVPAAASVLMLVMLASSMGLEPVGSLALGVSCLALSGAGASAALRSPASRAPGLVIALVTLGATSRLAARVVVLGAAEHAGAGRALTAWLGTGATACDVLAVVLAAVRLVSEQGGRTNIAVAVAVASGSALSWGAVRGSLDHAGLWQVVAARALGELSSSLGAAASMGGRVLVDSVAVLLAGVIVGWPGRLSSGAVAIALALLARSGVDVPASALMLSLGALVAALGSVPRAEPFSPVRSAPRSSSPRAEAPAGVDG